MEQITVTRPEFLRLCRIHEREFLMTYNNQRHTECQMADHRERDGPVTGNDGEFFSQCTLYQVSCCSYPVIVRSCAPWFSRIQYGGSSRLNEGTIPKSKEGFRKVGCVCLGRGQIVTRQHEDFVFSPFFCGDGCSTESRRGAHAAKRNTHPPRYFPQCFMGLFHGFARI